MSRNGHQALKGLTKFKGGKKSPPPPKKKKRDIQVTQFKTAKSP